MNSTSINAVWPPSINRIIKPYLQSIQQHLTNLDMFEQWFDNNFCFVFGASNPSIDVCCLSVVGEWHKWPHLNANDFCVFHRWTLYELRIRRFPVELVTSLFLNKNRWFWCVAVGFFFSSFIIIRSINRNDWESSMKAKCRKTNINEIWNSPEKKIHIRSVYWTFRRLHIASYGWRT